MRSGPDVSDWQETVDWRAVAAAGHSFGITKATEGTGNVQATLAANRSAMAAAGLEAIGLYHFARPENGNPAAQADHFCRTIGGLREWEFAVLDIEVGDVASWPGFITGWCSRVEVVTDRRPVVYMSESPAGSMPASCARWPLWVAGYVDRFPTDWADPRLVPVGPWAEPIMWQFTSSGRVSGIAGFCDLNVAPDDLPARLGLVVADVRPPPMGANAEEGPFMALNATQQQKLLDTTMATNDEVGKIATVVRDQVGGLPARLDRLEAMLAELLAR